ncbi:MAG: site-specific DNA-methyltransferase [Elusimicrobia bacterium CG03_land_8_20_14_0_80_50_18]|nr:MAG: site-specific DNA-methyltransferase [Elusimicrobia bacterium CG03_land_8_20_14_0_80_50_18]
MEFKKQITSVWSFPERGKWATHNAQFRGNFAPQIPRNIITRYSKVGDLVLDPMVGGGTTGIECRLLGRNFIGRDINPANVKLSRKMMHFKVPDNTPKSSYSLRVGDIRSLAGIPKQSIDLIITHPPYLNIIRYSDGKIDGDLSNISNVEKFCDELEQGAAKLYEALKENAYCAILIGDTRKRCHQIPLAYYVMQRFLKAGFILREDIIKAQHNCKSSPYWEKQTDKYNILLIMHEHLFVFRKPRSSENLLDYKWSRYSPRTLTF